MHKRHHDRAPQAATASAVLHAPSRATNERRWFGAPFFFGTANGHDPSLAIAIISLPPFVTAVLWFLPVAHDRSPAVCPTSFCCSERRRSVNRRRFLGQAMAGGALALGTGGFLVVRRSQARAAFTSSMLDDALPPLTRQSLRELTTLPGRARDEIRRFKRSFHRGGALRIGFLTFGGSSPKFGRG
jgi:hypothetical protein